MMKKPSLLLLLASLLCFGMGAQTGSDGNLQTIIDSIKTPLESDISTILDSVGNDVLDTLQANSLSGDVFGEATFGKKSFSITLPGIGISTSSGIGSALSGSVWESDILPLGPLIGNALSGTLNPLLGTSGSGGYDFVTSQVMVWPSVNVGFGINLGDGFEVFANGLYVPFSLIKDITGTSGSLAILDGLDGNMLQLQLKFRKVLVQDTPETMAVSVGLAYGLNAFNLSMDIDDATLATIVGGSLSIDGIGTLNINKMSVTAQTLSHNVGIELAFSKRLLFFIPFLEIAPYVQFSSAGLSMDLDASLTPTAASPIDLGFSPITKSLGVSDLSVLVNTGFELDLFLFTLHVGLALDLENLALNLGNLSPDQVLLNGVGANIGLRWAY